MKLSQYSLPKMLYFTINFSEAVLRKLKFFPHPVTGFPERNIRNSGNNTSLPTPQSEYLIKNHEYKQQPNSISRKYEKTFGLKFFFIYRRRN
jgi:hypothetical protein